MPPETATQLCRDQDSNLGFLGHNEGYWPLYDHGHCVSCSERASASNLPVQLTRDNSRLKTERYKFSNQVIIPNRWMNENISSARNPRDTELKGAANLNQIHFYYQYKVINKAVIKQRRLKSLRNHCFKKNADSIAQLKNYETLTQCLINVRTNVMVELARNMKLGASAQVQKYARVRKCASAQIIEQVCKCFRKYFRNCVSAQCTCAQVLAQVRKYLRKYLRKWASMQECGSTQVYKYASACASA